MKELDRVYSIYIRLRDADANGMCRCISCGRVYPWERMQCGHYFTRHHMATRWDGENCNAECPACVTPETRVLCADLYWRPIGELKVGDKIFGFEEEVEGRRKRRYKTATVLRADRSLEDVYAVEMENGDIINATADHKWMVRVHMGTSYNWIATKDLWIDGKRIDGTKKSGPKCSRTTSVMCKPFLVVEQEKSYEAGWLAGMIDADGHLCQQNISNRFGEDRYGFRIGVSQSEKYINIVEKIKRLISYFTKGKPCTDQTKFNDRENIRSNYKMHSFLVTGTNVEKVHFLQRVRPTKMDKFSIDKLGVLKSAYDTKVKSITYIGKKEVVVLETDSHTYIAEGYAMHNCNCQDVNHLEGYKVHLIEKIGQEAFDELERKHNNMEKAPTEEEYRELIRGYKMCCRKLARLKGISVSL